MQYYLQYYLIYTYIEEIINQIMNSIRGGVIIDRETVIALQFTDDIAFFFKEQEYLHILLQNNRIDSLEL